MKRFLLGAGWFVVLWFGVNFIGGVVVGATAGTSAANAAESYQAGQAAGQAFAQSYGGLILLASIAVAAIGTFMGWLPGTKPSDSDSR
jgi:hypothetical protein